MSSVQRAVQILELLARADEPMRLTAIARELGIPKSTTHSILCELTDSLAVVADAGGYSVGLKAFEIGSSFLRSTGSVARITPEMSRLTRVLNVVSHYAILDGADVVYLCKEDPGGLGIRLASSIGARLPAYLTAVGKSCLAWLPADDLPAHMPPSDGGAGRVATNPAALAAELESVRALGYSTDDGATAAGIQCVAAPVFDHLGPHGALGVSYLMASDHSIDVVAQEVLRSAEQATLTLGGKRPA
ncbi:MAG TPA: IclR family transcriptional regulator [Streptosporangiaceae bacterium]|jgi:DNA-binding IclR family transcriptional regulator